MRTQPASVGLIQHQPFDVTAGAATLDADGIVAIPAAFSAAFSANLFHDLMRRGQSVRSRPGGSVSRGPDRVYYSVPPETIRGFVEIVTHPSFRALCDTVIGAGWQVVEVGCDLPGPHAKDQPWHRDYAGAWVGNTLAFNVAGLLVPQVTAAMGPLQVAEGTHLLDGSDYTAGMFPAKELFGEFDRASTCRYPRQGDMSARSALTLHRGTAADPVAAEDESMRRPVLVVGVVAADVVTDHRIFMTHAYFQSLDAEIRDHVRVTHLSDSLPVIVEKHDIEGLLMSA